MSWKGFALSMGGDLSHHLDRDYHGHGHVHGGGGGGDVIVQ